MVTQTMSRRNALRLGLIGLASGLATLAGCGLKISEPKTKDIRQEYSEKTMPNDFNEVKTLEGRVVKATRATIPFVYYNGSATYGQNHEFVSVVIETDTAEDRKRVFLYPYSLEVLENEKVKIKYNPLIWDRISSDEFVKTFCEKSLKCPIDYTINARGIIIPKGIEYLKEN